MDVAHAEKGNPEFEEGIRRLRDKEAVWDRRKGYALLLFLSSFLLYLFALVLYGDETPLRSEFSIIVAIAIACCVGFERQADRLQDQIHDLLNEEYCGTAWKTQAGAIGFVIKVLDYGNLFRIALPSGVVGTYERNSLTRTNAGLLATEID